MKAIHRYQGYRAVHRPPLPTSAAPHRQASHHPRHPHPTAVA